MRIQKFVFKSRFMVLRMRFEAISNQEITNDEVINILNNNYEPRIILEVDQVPLINFHVDDFIRTKIFPLIRNLPISHLAILVPRRLSKRRTFGIFHSENEQAFMIYRSFHEYPQAMQWLDSVSFGKRRRPIRNIR
jgi:hypothetical protein